MRIKANNDSDILEEVKAGRYRGGYLIYNRKSTDEGDSQKNSISYQKSENARFAFRENFPIASVSIKGFSLNGIISEKHSGFKENDEMLISEDGIVQYRIERPKFQKMMQLVNEGYFKGIICLCWDRLSRNRGDDVVIRKMMRKDIDIRFVYAHYEKTSAGALHMDIDGMFAQHHSRVTSEKVSLTIKNARSKGICTYRAPIGYLNTGKMEQKPFDPERAPVIKRLFELYATGEWSLADLMRYAKDQGLVTVPMRRRRTREEMLAEEDEEIEIDKVSRAVTQNHISRIFTSLFYVGKILGSDGVYVKSASHEALVDENLFNRVQAMLNKNQTSIHYEEKLDLPFRGMLRCAYCERVYTPYMKKGIEYFNARCVPGCKNTFKNFNFAYISNELKGLIAKLHFTDEELAKIESRAGTDIGLLEERRLNNLDQMERKKKKIREDLSYLRTNRLTLLTSGLYTPVGLLAEETRLNDELMGLQTKEQVSDEAMHETMKDVFKLSELLQSLIPYYDFANPHEKQKIVRIVFSELYVSPDTLKYKPQMGFECFENRFAAVCEPTAWLSELMKEKDYIKSAIQNMQTCLTQDVTHI